jgi:DNA mismatch repair protein MutS
MNEGARMEEPLQTVSLLWPAGVVRRDAAMGRLGEDAIADLHVADVVAAIAGTEAPAGRRSARDRYAKRVVTELVWRPEVITYRQAILTDLLDDAALRERLSQILPTLEALSDAPASERYRPTAEPSLERVARRLGDLELLVDVVGQLAEAIGTAAVRSVGMQTLGRELDTLRRSPMFESLERELPELRATLSSVRSVTLGVNLGPDLMPESATILGLGSKPIQGRQALLWRLLGGIEASRGLTPLQRGDAGPLGRPNELVRDLRHLLSQVIAPVQSALGHYASVSTHVLSQLGAELGFLLGAAKLVERLRCAGLPMCRPEILPADDRFTELRDAYDCGLALSQLERGPGGDGSPRMVTNPVTFDRTRGRVWVLTGPNRGGKTTYTRAVGLAQVLFQAGLYVPASSAQLSPVDAIFTHFPTREDIRPGLGRLDAESVRLAAIFRQATPHSLILLNEALAGTSALEALDLARGLVRGLRLLGARAIYVTHLHELASGVDEINATTSGDGTVASLVAGAGDDEDPTASRSQRRTYHIRPGAPRGVSFAAEIAEQHGISFTQLAQLLRERQVVPDSAPDLPTWHPDT